MIQKPLVYPLNIQYYGVLGNEGKGQLQIPFNDDVFENFKVWVYTQQYLQLDVETNVTSYIRERKLITVQFGSVNQKQPVQWIFQWSFLKDEHKEFIKMILESTQWEKIIQNAAFELTVFLNYDVRVRRMYDTMLCERILWCGYTGVHQISTAIDAIVLRRLGYVMPKDQGMNFGDNIITLPKLVYAAEDIQFLDKIKNQQLLELHQQNLEYVAALENESVIGFAQMMWEGMPLDKEEWLSHLEWAHPLVEEAEVKCNEWLEKEPFRSRAIKLGYINTEDILSINWKSNPQKQKIVARIFPGCPGATKKVLENWMATQASYDQQILLDELLNGTSKTLLEDHLLQNHREWLIENEFLRPAWTSMINWNSTPQVLPLIQIVDPKLKNMNEDSMGKFSHPIGLDIEEYRERLKLLSTYGEKFLEHVDPDGRVRTNFNQIMTTGRVSTSSPNMQNITVTELVGTRYRNSFKPPPGCKFVSSDYVSQELVMIAYLTKDPNWNEALRKGQDLHSIASELVFGTDKNPYHISWKQAAERDCAYYKIIRDKDGKVGAAKQKCNCPRHKIMRSACKNINFGLAYGMTEYRLAAMLRISLKDAKALIVDYYKAMPAIGRTMTYLGNFGVRHGYIQTMAPFFRKRWFPDWQDRQRYIDEHISGIRPDWRLSSIEKEAKNQPIQGSSADCTKVAICMVMWELDEKCLHDTVKLVLQVHDQLDTVARDDYAETWKPRLTEIMEEAARLIIPNGLLKADTNITPVWSK